MGEIINFIDTIDRIRNDAFNAKFEKKSRIKRSKETLAAYQEKMNLDPIENWSGKDWYTLLRCFSMLSKDLGKTKYDLLAEFIHEVIAMRSL